MTSPTLPRRTRRILAVGAAAISLSLGLTGVQGAAHAAPTPTTPLTSGVLAAYDQTYRPQLGFSPQKNWMNDPNGLIYYKGVYHLFFQYNPKDEVWGNMSWGHATSTDLVHWTQQPLAIPQTFNAAGDSIEDIFSGSVVVDYDNTTGFGTRSNPAMVAVYTSYYPAANPTYGGLQAQSIAYSLDQGQTWTKYSGNPVLNINNANFRDPKVFWYAPKHEWRMVAVRATDHVVTIYGSKNLKQWTHLSDFGPTGATGGVWECPDLFPMAVNGDPRHVKWVMVVNLNPGAINGGSGAQYFVGSFDGTKFTSNDPATYTPPTGTRLQDFENGYGSWTTTGTAFGTAPATAALPGQTAVTGYQGTSFVDSFNGGDATTGVLSSPEFTISTDYLNFLVGGGKNPYVADTKPFGTLPAGTVFADFSGSTYGQGWVTTGDFVGTGPAHEQLGNQVSSGVLDTWGPKGDPSQGTITSPTFTINSRYIDLQIAGGAHPMSGANPTAVNLLVGGKVVATATGNDSGSLSWVNWDTSAYQGQSAQIQVVDQADGSAGWGHLMVGDIVFASEKAPTWDTQTSVNLVVNGQVVRSATGGNSESLDWTSWNLKDLQGQRAQIQVVDHATGGWGHILADDFTASDTAAQSNTQRAHWLDYGRDYYAAATFNGMPLNNRVQIAWMNNWDYANSIPTSPWRSADSLVRRLQLRTVNGRAQLLSTPVAAVNKLRKAPVVQLRGRIPSGTTSIRSKQLGQTLEIDATFKASSASQFGINVRTGNGQKTVIGYDTYRQGLYLDRTKSGVVDFNSTFPSVEFAPLAVRKGATVRMTIYVDRSSVQVFVNGGLRTFTEQVFPDPSSTGVQLFSTGASTTVSNLTIRPLHSIWEARS